MIGTIVKLSYPDGIDRSRVLKVAAESKRMFDGMPGLRRKVFMLDEEHDEAVNVYLWDSEEAARGFFTDDVTSLITDVYGVAPTIRHVEILAVVDDAVRRRLSRASARGRSAPSCRESDPASWLGRLSVASRNIVGITAPRSP